MHHSAKVLIVEDQFFIAVDSESALRAAGFECVGLATTAGEAYDLARSHHPDIVLMDINLAMHSDGLSAARQIYKDLGIRSIFASGHADQLLRQEAEDACPLGWLDKPYTNADLIREVQRSLEELRGDSSGTTH